MIKAAFIGVGNMGSALAKAACKSLGGDRVLVSNRTAAKAEALAREIRRNAEQTREFFEGA